MIIQTGSEKGTIGSAGVCTKDGCRYVDNGDHEPNVIYMQGEWDQEKEFVQHTSDREGYILVLCKAKEVGVKMEASGKIEADIFLDGKPLTKENAGKDVKISGKRSYVVVGKKGICNIVKMKKSENHEVKIVTNSSTFRIYKYTLA
ncbi:MAG: hypothetical protein NT120_04820 [Candidatus Aenigmarchaeota archaeon]|nr:hypothetical protein [Candidatus Aenigmarchaeota archaeon]